ncbi:hypothetical protein [Fibrobacter sp.]
MPRLLSRFLPLRAVDSAALFDDVGIAKAGPVGEAWNSVNRK